MINLINKLQMTSSEVWNHVKVLRFDIINCTGNDKVASGSMYKS